SGRGPWLPSSQPDARAPATSTESVPRTRTSTQRSLATGRRRPYLAAAWDTTPAWSGETTTWRGTSPERQARLWAGWLTKDTNPPMPMARTSRMQAAASSAVGRRRRRWARCLPTDARSFSIYEIRPLLGDRRDRGVVRASGSRTDWLPCPQRLPRSMPVCKILPGSGGFVAFPGDRTEEAVLLEWAGRSAARSGPGAVRRRVPEAGHPAEPAVQ